MNRTSAAPSGVTMVLTFVYVLAFPTLMFALAGTGRWIPGWIFTVWFMALCYGTIVYLYRNDPALLSERYRASSSDQALWDRLVVVLIFVGFCAWIVLMPLDAVRYGWTSAPPAWVRLAGFLGLLVSSFFFFRSFVDNTFLSPLVRIQEERDQRVVSTGVYGFVRHPMYLGGSLLFLSTPVLLGSKAGLAVGVLMTLLLAARIVGEERLLAAKLEGYEDYRRRVRYRLVPFVW